MAFNVVLILAGLLIAGLTLADVFETVVVPGGSRASLRTMRRLVFVLLPAWKRFGSDRRGVSSMFAPVALVGSFLLWIAFLILGFGLMAYGARSGFAPPVRGFSDALYYAGSAMVTVGLSETSATGAARWVVLSAGFCGLAVITLAVTYLLLVQGSVADRDKGILKLNTSAGDPPSALNLLEKFAAIDNRSELRRVLRDGRDWCATVRQSHVSHPSLIYFQSIGAGAGWPAALGALLDLGLFCRLLLDDRRLGGPGVLLCEEGQNMARQLASFLELKPVRDGGDAAALRQVAARLSASGYRLKQDLDYSAIAADRSELQAWVIPLAEHLGKPAAALVE